MERGPNKIIESFPDEPLKLIDARPGEVLFLVGMEFREGSPF